MPPRLQLCSQCYRTLCHDVSPPLSSTRRSYYASATAGAASAATNTFARAPSIAQMTSSPPAIARHPPSQPPSHKRPELRRSQIHRQYVSLLRSAPVTVFFQHNNLRANEWTAIRRELGRAMQKVDEREAAAAAAAAATAAAKAGASTNGDENGGGQISEQSPSTPLAGAIKFQVVQTGVFEIAMRVVEFYRPEEEEEEEGQTRQQRHPTAVVPTPISADSTGLTHGLSRAAWAAADRHRKQLPDSLSSLLLGGPLAVLSFPAVSPAHLSAALSVLCPAPPRFPPPLPRSANPGYYEPVAAAGLAKLLPLAARLDRRAFDMEGTRGFLELVGDNGLSGLRARLVALLDSASAALANTLEGAGRSVYFTLEGRKMDLEEKGKGHDETGEVMESS